MAAAERAAHGKMQSRPEATPSSMAIPLPPVSVQLPTPMLGLRQKRMLPFLAVCGVMGGEVAAAQHGTAACLTTTQLPPATLQPPCRAAPWPVAQGTARPAAQWTWAGSRPTPTPGQPNTCNPATALQRWHGPSAVAVAALEVRPWAMCWAVRRARQGGVKTRPHQAPSSSGPTTLPGSVCGRQ